MLENDTCRRSGTARGQMASIELYNIAEGAECHSPAIIVHGKISSSGNSVQVHHPQLPPLSFPVHNHGFKATIGLTPGENVLWFISSDNVSKKVVVRYVPMLQNPPIHLCLLVAKDSPLRFDSPKSQIQREGGNGLDLAVRKLRTGARIMQAFTNEQMARQGFGQRTFNFVEEFAEDTLFNDGKSRNTVKIHIIRANKTVAELRDPNVAQQNPQASNAGGLFSIAMEALEQHGAPFNDSSKTVQAAVIFLDTHWDRKLNFITAHAALGGGTNKIKLAIFGSHGLYSWPTSFQAIVPYFLDDTRSSTSEVANDCNQCGTHWECLAITLGAFMHEIGHSLGCPHQESGIMLRDYVILNRSFLTKEAYSLRTNSYGAQSPIFPKEECTWHRLDILRFLYHPSFTLAEDFYDPELLRPGQLDNWKYPRANLFPLGEKTATLKSDSGIYCVEVVCGDLGRGFLEYLPKQYGGVGPQKEIVVSLEELRSKIPSNMIPEYGKKFKVNVHAINAPMAEFDDFPALLNPKKISMKPYGLGENVYGIQSAMLGSPNRGKPVGIIPVNTDTCYMIRVYYGAAIDGIKFFNRNVAEVPQLPPRTYMGKVSNILKGSSGPANHGSTSLFGAETNNYADVKFENGEQLAGFNLRTGAWVDGIQIITTKGRVSEMFGSKNGGSAGALVPPLNKKILGVFGNFSNWVDGIGIVYQC